MENLQLLLEQANSGDALAQYKLARAFEIGDGVNKNPVAAKMWLQKSAENGYKNAENKLKIWALQERRASGVSNGAAAGAPITCVESHPSEAPKTIVTPEKQSQKPTQSTLTHDYEEPEGSVLKPHSMSQKEKVGQKSKAVAVVLAVFFWFFGAHDFYLGYKKQGVLKIIFSLTIILSFVSYFWMVIDLIKILCDGKLDSDGQLLK